MNQLIIGIALIFGLISNVSAAECTLYEQSHPAFLLDGSHLSTGKCSTCSTCHRGGVFMGTPRSCVTCHNGDPVRTTVSRSASHIPTALLECNSCHNTTSFMSNANMNHTSVSGQRCDTCHNGSYTAYGARSKTPTHIATTGDCNTCHSYTKWDVSHADLHANITTGCVSCHNGTTAVGKSSYSAGHPVTSDNCELCHSINNQFKCASTMDKLQEFASRVVVKIKLLAYLTLHSFV